MEESKDLERRGPDTDLIEISKNYFENMINMCDERKALILDEDTLGYISLNYSRSNLLEKNVYFFDVIDRKGTEKLNHLVAIFFVRNTNDNFQKIKEELEDPLFGAYYLVFANPIEDEKLRELAEADRFDKVRRVLEIFADFYAVNRDLFSFNIPTSMDLCLHESAMTPATHVKNNRILQGLLSVVLSCRKQPYVRFSKHSNRAAKLADSFVSYMSSEDELVARSSKDDEKCTLLILDRKDDPVTPLLNQWTYQSMVHELIGITKHRVKLADKKEEIVLNPDEDEFFKKNMYKKFPEVQKELEVLLTQFKEKEKSRAKIDNIKDMQRMVENFPEFKKFAGKVTKHYSAFGECSDKITKRKLFSVCELEQDIAVKNSKSEQVKEMKEILEDPEVDQFEKIRLVMLFSLRYEGDSNVKKFRTMLRESNISPDHIDFIDFLIQYAGKDKRSNFLFGKNTGLLKGAMDLIKSNFTEEDESVYTRHKSCLFNIIGQMVKGKLSESDFPFSTQSPRDTKTKDIIVFILGGATYQEAKEVADFNNSDPNFNVILGGTTVHNSKSFLAEVTEVRDYGL
ncbi:unnamed protein product [Moneuplotes crassus]|uniref:Vacuolar protein sorting-associated protein 45 n=2 Tax=Euplotes crassus TaxID=5936 RepID=A0AAD1XAU3_EUPCR|nr:unnamed protein product [Moneuplotes crassus]